MTNDVRNAVTEAATKAVVSAVVESVRNSDLFGKPTEIFVMDAAVKAAANAVELMQGISFTTTQYRAIYAQVDKALGNR